jgi:putative hydrolase of the HAD superfamily
MARDQQILLIDADDTLWETNIQFERVTDTFAEMMAPLGYDAATVRQRLNETERNTIREHGYGARSFLHSVEELYAALAGQSPSGEALEKIRGLESYFGSPQLIDGVVETLDYLAARHHLHLFSKGNLEEQSAKFNGSGLQGHFDGWDIVPEKNPAAYREVVARHNWTPAQVWMVGNSPRSDINPALAIGLNAVFIPSELSWSLEDEEIQSGQGKLLRLKKFTDLREHF